MTITKEGALASLYTGNKAPIKHLKVYFSPKQAGEGTPSPENVREISGWSELNTWHTNNNLLPLSDYSYRESGIAVSRIKKKISITGTSDGAFYRGVTGSWTADGSSVVLYNVPILTNGATWYVWNGTGNIISGRNINGISFRPASGVKVSLCLAVDYANITMNVEFTPIMCRTSDLSTIPVDWSSEVGTVYGGYVDLVTGELVENYRKIILDGSSDESWWEYSPYEQYKGFALNNSGLKHGQRQNGYANWMPVVSNLTSYNLECWLGVNNNTVIYCASTASLLDTYSLTAWRSYLFEHPLEIVIPLDAPITHTLSPTQLSTLIGRNNIWSNADRVEVEYDLAESNDELYRRRNILLRSAPHIETVSGNIAHFETDIAAPIKSAKISFNPVQEGSGDPSPENVRTISGWSGVNITRCGKNLLNTNDCYLINMSKSNEVFTNTAADTRSPVNFTLREQNGPDVNQVTRECFYINTSTTGKFVQNFTINNDDTTYLLLKHNGASKDLRMLFRWAAGTGSFKFIADIDGANPTAVGGFTLHNIQIIKLNDNDEYEPYTGSTIPIDWQTVAGTIYGGYVDLVAGKLIMNIRKTFLNDPTQWRAVTKTRLYGYYTPISDRLYGNAYNVICPIAPSALTSWRV